MDKNYQAHIEFNNLISIFKSAKKDNDNLFDEKSNVHLLNNKYNNDVYPENYGGAFYDSKSEKLNICLTSKSLDYQNSITNKDIVEYQEVKYSLTMLLNTMELIYEVMPKYHIDKVVLSQRKNRIIVYNTLNFKKDEFISFLSESKINLNCIIFSEEKIVVDNTTLTIPAGSALANDSLGTKIATIGCNGYKLNGSQTIKGVITAGHAYDPYRDYYTASGNYIGDNADTFHKYENCYDAMFIPFKNQTNYNLTTRYINSTSSSPTMGNIDSLQYVYSGLEGETVAKYGMRSGRVTGEITEAFSSFMVHETVGNVTRYWTLKDFFDVDGLQISGDSGAPVGIETGSKPNKNMSLLGIATQGFDKIPDSNNSYSRFSCCKATNINGYIAFIEY